jgi:hypothetical protein
MTPGPNQTFDSFIINYLQAFDAKTGAPAFSIQNIGRQFLAVDSTSRIFPNFLALPLS